MVYVHQPEFLQSYGLSDGHDLDTDCLQLVSADGDYEFWICRAASEAAPQYTTCGSRHSRHRFHNLGHWKSLDFKATLCHAPHYRLHDCPYRLDDCRLGGQICSMYLGLCLHQQSLSSLLGLERSLSQRRQRSCLRHRLPECLWQYRRRHVAAILPSRVEKGWLQAELWNLPRHGCCRLDRRSVQLAIDLQCRKVSGTGMKGSASSKTRGSRV